MTEHTLWVKSFLLPHIKNEKKDLELRLNNRILQTIQKDDIIVFNAIIRRRVVAIRHYGSLEEACRSEPPERLWPGHDREEILAALQKIYKNNQRGVLIFELAYIAPRPTKVV